MNITTLKGIGTKTAELFAKLGIYTTQDLLKFYPMKNIHILEIMPL